MTNYKFKKIILNTVLLTKKSEKKNFLPNFPKKKWLKKINDWEYGRKRHKIVGNQKYT